MYQNPLTVVPYWLHRRLNKNSLHVHEVSHVTHQRSAFRCNDYVRNEVCDTFYKDYLEFKHMNDM